MSRRTAVRLATGLSAVLIACQPAPGPLTPEEVAAVATVSEQFVALVRAQDWDAVSQLYTEDAVVMSPNEGMVRGRAAIREWLGSFPPLTEFTLADDRIEGVGDLAYAIGRYVLAVAIEGVPADTGKYVVVLRKQDDGAWKLSVDIFNSDIPLPTPE